MQTAFIPYQDQETSLEGFAAYPSAEKHPAVILCHAWAGRDDFICGVAKQMAGWGYVGFALDMYGKGMIGKSKEENASLKKSFLEQRELLQRRIVKSFNVAQSLSYVDPDRIAVLGFGFGGLCALDLARSGAALKGAISVYGHFDPPPESLIKPIQAKILILHGYNDPLSPQMELLAFEKEMDRSQVDWQIHTYGNTMHAFITPGVNHPSAGLLYNSLSANRAWQSISQFLTEIFS